jgi:hypothetical protein
MTLATLALLALMSLSALAADTTPMSPAAVDTEMRTAKEHLATLSQLCRITCEEYRDLKKAVAAYK